MHAEVRAQGLKVINSDFAFEIEGFEGMWLSTKQCPWPEMSPAGEIEVAGPLGGASWQPQQAKFNLQGPISLYENRAGDVDTMLVALLLSEARFNAKIYEGTPSNFLRYKYIRDAFIQMDTPDRDFENRAQILTFSGTLFYHYFGEQTAGTTYHADGRKSF